jgi:hypothetical protein
MLRVYRFQQGFPLIQVLVKITQGSVPRWLHANGYINKELSLSLLLPQRDRSA